MKFLLALLSVFAVQSVLATSSESNSARRRKSFSSFSAPTTENSLSELLDEIEDAASQRRSNSQDLMARLEYARKNQVYKAWSDWSETDKALGDIADPGESLKKTTTTTTTSKKNVPKPIMNNAKPPLYGKTNQN